MGNPGPTLRIAIADESTAFAAAAAAYIATLPGYVLAASAETADVLLLDLGAAPARGLEVLRRIRAVPGAPAVVAMTLFHSAEAAAAAICAGAVGLVGKDAFISGLTQVLAELSPPPVAA
jgi:DNA-binding NarL/FixJ family response regulator